MSFVGIAGLERTEGEMLDETPAVQSLSNFSLPFLSFFLKGE
jgi:hypothetical protein